MVRRFDNHIYRTVVVVWLTLSVASVFLAAVTWVQLSNKLDAAREAAHIETAADHILRLIVDCETGVRGYVITGKKEFLEPFTEGKQGLPREFDRLVGLSRNDPALLRQVIELRASSDLIIARLDMLVASMQKQGPEVAGALIATGAGKVMMDKMRTRVAGIRGMRSSIISEDGATARNQLVRASLTSLIAGIIGIGAGVFAFWLSRVTIEHQQRERELVEAKLEAERSNQEKTVFLANMSHEIRTPMNAIIGFGELLAGEIQEPKQRRYLQSIRSSATSLLQLINDILDMAKIEAGVMTLNQEPTDPREICNFVHAMFSEPAAKKNVKLECIVAEDLPRALLLDRIRLRQILVNLVGNAVKFTNKGEILISVTWEKSESSGSQITLIIEVQDTGVGIPQDKLEAIFKPFVQAGAHRDIERQGTGLGLSIVRRLTEMMNGTVTAASVMGQGSAFHLRFPNVHISARLPISETNPPESEVNFSDLRASTLLVVDDNETNCELIAGMFAGSHHRLIFAYTGQAAVGKSREHRPDAILLDIRMPGMDGRQALAEIRKIAGMELTPIIAVTAAKSSLKKDEPDLRESFSGYVRKPFSKRELFDELAHFLPRTKTDPAAETKSPASPIVPRTVNAPVAAELVSYLNQILQNEWPAVRDGGAINETKAFAAKLLGAAQNGPAKPLREYARTLEQYAENYLVANLEKLLDQFPAFVKQLEGGQSK